MRFRAVMVDAAAMKDFMNIAVRLSKLAKCCVMRLTSQKVYFIICDEDNGSRKPSVWCELFVNFYFKEYNLVGVSDEYNEIYLEFTTAMFASSLTTLKQNAKMLKIKLTNKQTPCITLEMELAPGESIQTRQCVHDIPVETIPRKYWSDFEEPHFDEFHVSIQMPNLKSLKHIVERMKSLSHSLIVSANKFGRLTLQIKSPLVSLSAHFPDLSVESFAVGLTIAPSSDNEMEHEDDNLELHTVSTTIDIKKFLMFLAGMQMNKTICSIVHGQMLKLFLEQPGAFSLQCVLTELSD